MLKLFGICVLFLSARIFYENIMDKKEISIKKIEDIIMLLNLTYVNVTELKMTLPVAVEIMKFKISPFIDNFCEKFCEYSKKYSESSPREAVLKAFFSLDADRKVKKEAEAFFQIVGTADKETVINYKNTVISACERILNERKTNFEKNKKTLGAMTFGISSVLVIMLI